MGFPSKNDHFGVFWEYHHLRKHPYTVSVVLRWVLLLIEAQNNPTLLSQTWWAGAVHRLAESLRRTEPPEF